MSYNIQFVVNDDGIIVDIGDVTTTHPDTLPRGRFIISGHVVPDGEQGAESVLIVTPDYAITAAASKVVRHA